MGGNNSNTNRVISLLSGTSRYGELVIYPTNLK